MIDCKDQTVIDFTAKARKADPIQSHKAADKKNGSDTLSADRLAVLEAVRQCPCCTAKQLDMMPFNVPDTLKNSRFPKFTWLGGKAHRRAVDLERLGLIVREKSGREMTMRITDLGLSKLNIERLI